MVISSSFHVNITDARGFTYITALRVPREAIGLMSFWRIGRKFLTAVNSCFSNKDDLDFVWVMVTSHRASKLKDIRHTEPAIKRKAIIPNNLLYRYL
jgi:hypothetical protein